MLFDFEKFEDENQKLKFSNLNSHEIESNSKNRNTNYEKISKDLKNVPFACVTFLTF